MIDDFKTAAISWMMSSNKALERQDELVDKIYNTTIKNDYLKKEIQAFFKLHKNHIHLLSHQSIKSIMRMLKMLELDADTRSEDQLELDQVADRDIEWNKGIGAILLQKLREADAVLGTPLIQQQNPSDVAMGKIAIDALLKNEKLDIEKSMYDTSKRDDLKKEMGR